MGKGLNLINKNNRANVPEKKECSIKLSGMRIFWESAKKTLSQFSSSNLKVSAVLGCHSKQSDYD